MTSKSQLRRAVRYALYANAAAIAVPAVAAAADAPATEAAITEVVVTGSRISEPGLQSISPVTSVSSEEIKAQGITRVEDLLNSLPQVAADQGGNISNGSDGTAAVNLRGLGAVRTLVLVNGRRLMPGSPTNAGTGAADLNNIPAALVDRVDVLTGGASSVYGADAVAGVVNFVMNDHFQGFRLDMNADMYNHNQHNYFGDRAPAAGYGSASSTVNDAKTKDFTAIMGGNFADGKGNVTGYVGYRRLDPLVQANRDFSRCTLGDNAAGVVKCQGSSTNATGRFLFTNGAPLNVTLGPNQTFVPYTAAAAYNYGALNFYQRPDERWTGGFFAHYNMTEHTQFYSEFMVMNDRSIAQIAPSGAFLGSGTSVDPATGIPNGAWAINCNNPLLSATQQAAICNGGQVNGISQVIFGRRNIEGGPRQDDLSHFSFRAVVGMKGDFADAWNYDVYAQEGRTALSENYLNDVSKSRLTSALQVVNDPKLGLVCAQNAGGANGAPGCIPYNVWGSPLISPTVAVPYFTVPGFQEGLGEERIFSGNITGDFTKYGVKLPTASTGLIVNFGGEYREEFTSLRTDIEFQTNDLAGQGNPTLPLDAGLGVKEGFVEARLPLIQDHTFAKELSFETGYRYSKYTLGFSTNTYKFGLDWAPTSDVRLRGSYNRAVRAPNIAELFAQTFVANDGATDPCATSSGSPATATLAQCQLTGVTPAQYGGGTGIPGNPAGQYNGKVGGNPHLKPETADTYTFGVVLTPTALPGFNLTVDYFDIKIKQVISSYGSDFSLNQCLTTGNPTFCSLVHRDATGSIWLSTSGYVDDPTLNLGSLATKGVDLNANYRLDMGRGGRLAFQMSGTYTASFFTEPVPGLGKYDCAGYYGITCGTPTPKWRHKLRTTWDAPWAGLGLSAQWRHISSVQTDNNSPNALLNGQGASKPLEDHLGSRDYFDLSASMPIYKGVSARIGVNNVLDKDPPIIAGGDFSSIFVNGNTYPQVYDTLGRFLFLNITADF